MILAFNSLIECMTTGLFVALFLKLFTYFDILPIMFIQYTTAEEEVNEDE